jgi:putative redox protein
MSFERSVRLTWQGTGLQFEGGGTQPHTPSIVVDGDGEEGPSPMITLLLAAAGCSGADVVLILEKMRVALRTLRIDVTGIRREREPRRYTAIRFRFEMAGDGLDLRKAERAVGLSIEKYCSVVASLAPDIVVEHEVVLA